MASQLSLLTKMVNLKGNNVQESVSTHYSNKNIFHEKMYIRGWRAGVAPHHTIFWGLR